jgi:hypothetical protein
MKRVPGILNFQKLMIGGILLASCITQIVPICLWIEMALMGGKRNRPRKEGLSRGASRGWTLPPIHASGVNPDDVETRAIAQPLAARGSCSGPEKRWKSGPPFRARFGAGPGRQQGRNRKHPGRMEFSVPTASEKSMA